MLYYNLLYYSGEETLRLGLGGLRGWPARVTVCLGPLADAGGGE